MNAIWEKLGNAYYDQNESYMKQNNGNTQVNGPAVMKRLFFVFQTGLKIACTWCIYIDVKCNVT